MNSEKKKQLEREIQIITKITLEAQESFLIVTYLEKPENDGDINYEKKMNSFFYFSKFTFWQKTVLELSKIYIIREKFSLIKLISKLKKDGEYSQILISETDIENWSNKINENKLAIENLKLQRDKVYAHEDGKTEEIGNVVSSSEIRELTKLSFTIINSIRKSLELSYLQPDLMNSPATNLDYCINRLVKEKTTGLNELRGVAKKYNLENELPPE
jgi:ATP-dependent helicase YprA (DUF1998 family)